jgi:hypothetical protein
MGRNDTRQLLSTGFAEVYLSSVRTPIAWPFCGAQISRLTDHFVAARKCNKSLASVWGWRAPVSGGANRRPLHRKESSEGKASLFGFKSARVPSPTHGSRAVGPVELPKRCLCSGIHKRPRDLSPRDFWGEAAFAFRYRRLRFFEAACNRSRRHIPLLGSISSRRSRALVSPLPTDAPLAIAEGVADPEVLRRGSGPPSAFPTVCL